MGSRTMWGVDCRSMWDVGLRRVRMVRVAGFMELSDRFRHPQSFQVEGLFIENTILS